MANSSASHLSKLQRQLQREEEQRTRALRVKFACWRHRHGHEFFVDGTGMAARQLESDRGDIVGRSTLRAWARRGWIVDVLTERVGSGAARFHYEVTEAGEEACREEVM